MGWRDDWYPHAVAALSDYRGAGPRGTDGVAVPLLHGTDTIGLLGQLSPSVVQAIINFHNAAHSGTTLADRAMPSAILTNGVLDLAGLAHVGDSISVRDYVAGYGQPQYAYRRATSIGGETYEPWIVDTVSAESQLLGYVRNMLGSWQRAIDASASAIRSCGTNLATVASSSSLTSLLSAVRSLCADLDVLRENPPLSSADKIRGAALSSLHVTEEWVGEQAANAASEVGKLAGNVGKGFFSEAGMMSLVVAGIAVFLFLR